MGRRAFSPSTRQFINGVSNERSHDCLTPICGNYSAGLLGVGTAVVLFQRSSLDFRGGNGRGSSVCPFFYVLLKGPTHAALAYCGENLVAAELGPGLHRSAPLRRKL